MAFKLHEHAPELPSRCVRITKGSLLRISAALARQCCKEKPRFLSLYFDQEAKKVGLYLQATKNDTIASYTLNSSRDDWHTHCSIVGFVKSNKLTLPITAIGTIETNCGGKDLIVFSVEEKDGEQ